MWDLLENELLLHLQGPHPKKIEIEIVELLLCELLLVITGPSV